MIVSARNMRPALRNLLPAARAEAKIAADVLMGAARDRRRSTPTPPTSRPLRRRSRPAGARATPASASPCRAGRTASPCCCSPPPRGPAWSRRRRSIMACAAKRRPKPRSSPRSATGSASPITSSTPGSSPGASLQAQARTARYRVLGAWAIECDLGAVASGHHADDQAETLLMRLARGAGLSGLAATRRRRVLEPGVMLVRPLLDWRRAELRAIVAAAGPDPGRRSRPTAIRATTAPAFAACWPRPTGPTPSDWPAARAGWPMPTRRSNGRWTDSSRPA